MPTEALIDMFSREELKEISKKLCKMSSNKRSKQAMIQCLVEINELLGEVYNKYREHREREPVDDYFKMTQENLEQMNMKEIRFVYRLFRQLCKKCNGRTKTCCSDYLQWLMRYAKEFDKISI